MPRGGDRLDPRCCEFRLVTTPGGGFRLESARGVGYAIGPPDDGLRTVEGGGRLWVLRTSPSHSGFVLESASEPGREVARTVRDPTVGVGIFLEDGRCFWIVPRVDVQRRYELRGWEVDGAYWVAEPRGEDWCLSPTPAGAFLQPDEIVLLFAAEIVAARGDSATKPGLARGRTESGMNHGT